MTKETIVRTSVDGISENQWNNVIRQSETGSLFHRTEWLRAIENGLGSTPRHVVVEENGNPIGIYPGFVTDVELPESPIALPNTTQLRQLSSIQPGFGGPVVSSMKGPVLDLLLDGVETACSDGVVAHQIRMLDTTYTEYAQYFEKNGYSPSLLNCYILIPLTSWDTIAARMNKERRRSMRRADEEGVSVVREDLSTETLRTFYAEYERMISRVDGRLFPWSFFEELLDQLGDRIRIYSATLGDTPIGYHFYLLDEEQASIHHFFSGIRAENFGHHPSSAIHARVLQWGLDEGYDTYNFGESGANFNDGEFIYKKRYGGDVLPILTWEKGYAPIRWNAYRLARRIYRTYSRTLNE